MSFSSGSSRGSSVKVQVLLPAPPKSLENTEFSRLFAFLFPLSHGGRGIHDPPQGQKRKMFLTAKIFLKLFFDTEKATRLFRSGGGAFMISNRQTGICQPNCFLISAFTLSKSLQVKIGIRRSISSMLLSHHLNLSSNSISSSSKRF